MTKAQNTCVWVKHWLAGSLDQNVLSKQGQPRAINPRASLELKYITLWFDGETEYPKLQAAKGLFEMLRKVLNLFIWY